MTLIYPSILLNSTTNSEDFSAVFFLEMKLNKVRGKNCPLENCLPGRLPPTLTLFREQSSVGGNFTGANFPVMTNKVLLLVWSDSLYFIYFDFTIHQLTDNESSSKSILAEILCVLFTQTS